MNGVLLNPDEFEGRNPLENLPQRPSWHILSSDNIMNAWPGSPLGLNVRVDPPRKKGDAYRSGQHYKSKHDPETAPTASTIAINGPVPGVTNIAGEDKMVTPKVLGFMGKTLGKRIGSYSAEAMNFLKKNEKHPPLPFPKRFHYEDEDQRRPRPPKVEDNINNLLNRNQIDFVIKNKVDCLMAEPTNLRPDLLRQNSVNRLTQARTTSDSASPRRSTERLKTQKLTKEEMKLEETRRSDFEALLRGQDPRCEERQRRLAVIAEMKAELMLKKGNESLNVKGDTEHRTKSEGAEGTGPIRTFQRAAQSRPVSTVSRMPSEVSEYGFEGRTVQRIPKDARRQLIRSLKQRWDEVNKEYQLLTLSLFNLDTVHKVTKKEACEELMMRLEKEIYRLSKGDLYLTVDNRPTTTK